MALHPKVIDLSLGRVETLLERLGNPHHQLPPVVHVAGTNGKGSTVAFLRAMLEAAGYRVHVYTSPHLVHFNERIRLAGQLIDDADLSALLAECEAVNGGDPITFFEVTTAAAFLAFSRTPADILLLETGLGGRLDATNVIDRPLLSIITPVSVDHQNFLGDTLEEIAGEKAGILKPDVPCILARQERKADRKIAERATEISAPLLREGKDWFVRTAGDEMVFEAPFEGDDPVRKTRRLPLPSLSGIHQQRNAALALAALERMPGFDVSDAAAALGLKSVEWPARLQHLRHGPLTDLLPAGWELWLDGGHNEAAAKAIRTQTRQWRDKPLHLVFGMLNSRDPEDFLKQLEARIGLLRGVAIPGEENTLSAERICEAATTWRMDNAPAVGVGAAVADIVAASDVPARILIAGSLYLAGTVLKDNG